MKKYFTIICFGLITIATYSQKQTKFGVFVDPKICWFSPESREVKSDGPFWGFGGGLQIDRYFDKNYAFSTGISIGSQGGKLLFTDTLSILVYNKTETFLPGTTLESKLQYINIPIGLKLKSNQIGYTTFTVNLGFTGQINIKAEGTTNSIGNTRELEGDSIKDDINWYNLCYHFGGGVEYSIGEDTSLLFGIQYQSGFLDITKLQSRTLTRLVSISAGIMF